MSPFARRLQVQRRFLAVRRQSFDSAAECGHSRPASLPQFSAEKGEIRFEGGGTERTIILTAITGIRRDGLPLVLVTPLVRCPQQLRCNIHRIESCRSPAVGLLEGGRTQQENVVTTVKRERAQLERTLQDEAACMQILTDGAHLRHVTPHMAGG